MNEAVYEAALVCVPSLWSAPAEGALIKSLVVGRAVAVVQNDTALASELPDGLVLKLSPDPAAAARQLADAVSKDSGCCLPTVIWARWTLEREPNGKCRLMMPRLIAAFLTLAPPFSPWTG